MTRSYALTPEAEDDIFGIWQYIAVDNPRAADRQARTPSKSSASCTASATCLTC